jgi:ligand-binding sensor domain-containing protein
VLTIFSLFLLLHISIYPQSKTVNFEHITVTDGLTQNTVICLYQDCRGFLWAGTQGGLNRYDGYRFKTFKHNPDDSTRLIDNYVTSILEEKDENLWIGTWSGGLNIFNIAKLNEKGINVDDSNLSFMHYQHNANDPNSLSDNGVNSICLDGSRNLWIGTYDSVLNKFVKEKNQFIHYKDNSRDNSKLAGTQIISAIQSSNSKLWIGTWGGSLKKFLNCFLKT